MEQFCATEGVPYEICGKVIVATSEAELPALDRIFERGQANGVKCELIDRARLAELEPHAAGVRAIHVPEAGIVDYPRSLPPFGSANFGSRRAKSFVTPKSGPFMPTTAK